MLTYIMSCIISKLSRHTRQVIAFDRKCLYLTSSVWVNPGALDCEIWRRHDKNIIKQYNKNEAYIQWLDDQSRSQHIDMTWHYQRWRTTFRDCTEYNNNAQFTLSIVSAFVTITYFWPLGVWQSISAVVLVSATD